MFSPFLNSLAQGEMPDEERLRSYFERAVVKKMGVLRLPYHFWHNDTKINPSTLHMFWAAVLLRDRDGINLVIECIQREHNEAARNRSQTVNNGAVPELSTILLEALQGLQAYVPSGALRSLIIQRCAAASDHIASLFNKGD